MYIMKKISVEFHSIYDKRNNQYIENRYKF